MVNKSVLKHFSFYTMRSQGIALVQILIIVAILSTVALYVLKSAKQQVQMAQWALDRSQANVNLHSAQSDVFFELLTSKWQSNRIASDLQYEQNKQPNNTLNTINDSTFEKKTYIEQKQTNIATENNLNIIPWNLYNQAFALTQGVIVQIQDQAGLLNLHYSQVGTIKQRLMYAGLTNSEALSVQDNLLDWQDNDNIPRDYGNERNKYIRNNIIADKREWLLQKTISTSMFSSISNDFTLYGSGYLNLMTSPKSVLAALSNEDVAEQIVKSQQDLALTEQQVAELIDLSSEVNMYFFASRTLAITLTVSYGEAQIKKIFIVKFTPYTDGVRTPFNIMQVSNG